MQPDLAQPEASKSGSSHSSSLDFMPSSPSSSDSDNSSRSSSSTESTPRKFRSVRELYESCTFALLVADPTCYEDAAKNQTWQEAMNEEMSAIRKNETWELVDMPEDKNVAGLKWVFRTKFDADGSIQKHKARLVAKGYSQQQGIDYEETFSLVARFETVRVFLAFTAQMNLLVYQFDVKSAFFEW